MAAKKRSGIVTWEALQESILETIDSLPPIRIIYDVHRPICDASAEGGKSVGVVHTDSIDEEAKNRTTS